MNLAMSATLRKEERVGLSIKDSFNKERFSSVNGTYYYKYYFYCKKCNVIISSQHNYLSKHSGLCNSCSHKKRPYQAAYTQLLGNQKKGRVDVYLTYEDFIELCKNQNCHYCGKYINRSLKRGEKGYRGYFVDRVDNDLPYTKENCVTCCWECNQAKGNRYSYKEFLLISNLLKECRNEQKHWLEEIWFDGEEGPRHESDW